MFFKKIRYNVRSINIRDPSFVVDPSGNVLFRVRPKQVAQESSVRHLNRPHYPVDLFQIVNFRRKTTVHADYFFVNDCTDGKTVKTVSESLPKFDIVPPLAFVIKTVNSVDLRALVVSSE